MLHHCAIGKFRDSFAVFVFRSYVFDGIRASFPKLDLDDTFSSKDDIATHVQTDLKTLMSEYGYEIVNTLIVDIDPDKSVQRAMNEINGKILTSLSIVKSSYIYYLFPLAQMSVHSYILHMEIVSVLSVCDIYCLYFSIL